MLKEKLELVPAKPGCYLMENKNNQIIYVGKAKNLKSRLKSYFTGKNNFKTETMVSHIRDFKYIITTNEKESLILEINLIKKYNPKYNILLKDDKTYPYIELTKEENPRLIITREPNKKNYIFGPYPNAYAARETVNLLNRTYPIRKCKYIPKKECLYYHIDECLAPCINSITDEDRKYIDNIKKFLRGNFHDIKKHLIKMMDLHASKLEYELAQRCKDLLSFIEVTLEKQKIVTNNRKNIDVFSYYYSNDQLSINILFIRNGVILATKNKIIETIDSDVDELLEYIFKYYQKNSLPDIIYLPAILEKNFSEDILNAKIHFPKIGEKKKLIQMASQNAKQSLNELNKLKLSSEEKTINATKVIGELLKIKYPKRIEAFDNSHLFGHNAVSAMVVFIDGVSAKKEYRKYKVRYSKENDEYAILREVIGRRYSRVLNENLQRPDLILLDGGKGQINAAKEVLKELDLDIPVAGLKKNKKHYLDCLVNQELEEIIMKKSTPQFRLLNKIDEEVHRFAITYHQKLRSKASLYSELDNIEGIGPKRKKELLKQFGSIKKIKEATLEELVKIIPLKIAKDLKK